MEITSGDGNDDNNWAIKLGPDPERIVLVAPLNLVCMWLEIRDVEIYSWERRSEGEAGYGSSKHTSVPTREHEARRNEHVS